MAYIFGTAFSKLWRFISPGETPVPHPSPSTSSFFIPPPEDTAAFATASASAAPVEEPLPNLEAYTNHDMGSARRRTPAAKKDAAAGKDVEIPWLKIHMAHMSNLKGQLKYLRMIGEKKGVTEEVDKYVKRTLTCIRDAEAAAEAAGILPKDGDSKKEKRSKRRLSVTFADEAEVSDSLGTKKVKTKEDPSTTTSKIRKRFSSKPKPSAEKLATLKPALGKRSRASPDSDDGEEEKEEKKAEPKMDKPIKRMRVRYLQSDDPPCKYEGDPDTDEDDENDADFAPSSPLASDSPPSSSPPLFSPPASSSANPTTGESAPPSALKDPRSPKITTEKGEVTTESPKKQRKQKSSSAGKEPQSPKSSKHPAEHIEAPSAKKQKNTAMVVAESSKRRSGAAEEEILQASLDPSSKNAKRLKSV